MKDIKKRNIRFTFLGFFFIGMAATLLSFFLPFYLKQEGFNILEIGALFTVGLAVGGLIFSFVYSKILKKIQLKSGLMFSALLGFLHTFLFFIIPNAFGAIASKFIHQSNESITQISVDVSLQHNLSKGEHRKISSYYLIISALSIVLGIGFSLLLINLIGFRTSFLIFAFLTFPAFLFYFKVNDKTRFKLKEKIKLPKISTKLKLILFSEILYWLALGASFALVITFLVTDRFGGSMFWIGYLFIALYASITITTLLTRKFLNKYDLIKTSILGMIILFLSAVLIIISTNIYFVLGAMILEGIGAGIWVPSKMAIYWKLTGKESREKVSGYLNGWRSFVRILGPLVGGFLVTYFGGILSPFYFKATLSLLVLGIYIYVLRKS